MPFDKSIKDRLKKKVPHISADATQEELLSLVSGYDVIVAAKDTQGVWRIHATGSSVKDPEQKRIAVAEIVLSLIDPQ